MPIINHGTAFVAIAIVWSFSPMGASAAEGQRAPGNLYDQLREASVEILVGRHLNGSGCIADPAGIVLTAAHVVRQAKNRIEVMSGAIGRLPAELIAIDEGHDVALLRLPEREPDYPHLEVAEKTPLAGQVVQLFGAPLFRHGVLIRGNMARNGTTFEYVDGHYIEVAHVCAPAAKGVSGGPWVNQLGQVVGVQSSLMSLGNAQQGIAFVAPAEAVGRLLADKRSARTPTIGVAVEELWEQPPDFIKEVAENVAGLVARRVKPDGPAARSGVAERAIIAAVDGRPVQFRDEFVQMLRNRRAGEDVELTLLDRTGKNRRQVTVRSTALEQDASPEPDGS